MIRAIGLVAVSSKVQTEGVSLDEQEKAIRALCDKHGWILGETVRLPGVSRSNRDMLDYFTDDNPKHAPFRYLRDRIKSGEYQALVSYDNGRIGRTTSLFTYLARLAIDYRMIVATHMTGIIDEENAAFAIPIAAMNAEGEVKRRVDMTAKAKNARVERGLHLSNPPVSHTVVRDERGRAIRLELRTDTRRLIDDAATLVLEGVGWASLPTELRDRFGHISPITGKRYAANYWYRFFHNPFVWGHAARGYDHKNGVWAFDETAPLPPGIVVTRDVVPPAFTGATAERLKTELRRRADIIKGHASPTHTYKFTGLIVCDECGRNWTVLRNQQYATYWKCPHVHLGRLDWRECHQTRYLRDDLAMAHINAYLEMGIEDNRSDLAAFATPQTIDDPRTRIDALEAEIRALNDEIATMITQQSKAPAVVQEHYARLITEAGARLDVLKANLAESRTAVPSPEHARARQHALAEIQTMGLETFWQLNGREINQRLYAALGKHRFTARDGHIVGIK